MATIHDVAKVAGVSSTTVSHVVNGTRKVGAETAERVRMAIADLNYTPSIVAQSLRRRATRTIGIVSDLATNPFFADVVSGIEERCYERDYAILLSFSHLGPDREFRTVLELQRRGIEALVYNSIISDSLLGDFIKKLEIPVILFQRHDPDWPCDSLCTDDNLGAEIAMQHLFDLGHHRVALLSGGGSRSNSMMQRQSTYCRLMTQHFGAYNPHWIVDARYTHQGGYEETKRILTAKGDKPTAFFCIADQVALGCVAAIQDSGLRVPEDISVIGYDNLSYLSYLHPSLSSIDHFGKKQGHLIADRLFGRIANPDLPFERIVIKPELHMRATTAKAPTN